MNKVIVGSVVSGLIGVALGGGGVYLYFKKLYDVTKDEEYQAYREELLVARNTINDLQKQVANKLVAAKDELVSNNEYSETVLAVSSDDIVDSSADDQDENIRFIGPDDYKDDDDFEKETIKYYSKDSIITLDDEILEKEEFESMCGTKALKSFGMFGAGDGEVYVRNEEFCTDYKITRYNISYEKYTNSMK